MRRWLLAGFGFALLLWAACGPERELPVEVVLPDLSSCNSAWRTIHPIGIKESAPAMVWNDGVLYYSTAHPPQILAVPASGGEPRLVADDSGWKLWIEGDRLVYAHIDDRLWAVPLAGGTPAVIADGHTTFAPPSYSFASDVELDDSHFYWDLIPQIGPTEWSIWRLPRAGGVAQKLANLPFPDPAYSWRTLTRSDDAILVALSTQGAAYAVPLAGGGARPLPGPPSAPANGNNFLLGTGVVGVLWMLETWDSNSEWPSTKLTMTDALDVTSTRVRPFWPEKPPAMRPHPLRSSPQAAGGWIVTGSEWFSDGDSHASMWTIDAVGKGTRLGCDPVGRYGFTAATALTPDGIYAVVGSQNGQSSYFDYAIVKIGS